MRDPNSPVLPQPGDLLAGRYRIQKQLGAGGFGIVFQAKQESMRRDVAIKTLLPHISEDPVACERFRREAFYASGLSHPNTITIHDYGQSESGLFYIVMELLEGESLARAIYRSGGLVLGRAMRIGVQVLRSLGEAHQKGLVHRDLKPENIFLSDILGEHDFVKVLDFGLSKALRTDEEETSLTQHGMVFGTPLYMAPEQAYGDPVTPAADVFAFGLLFYEMLVGERPYSGLNQMDVMMKITREPMPRLPAPLDKSAIQVYLDKLTEKDLKDRYSSAVEALPTLERLCNGEGLDQFENVDRVYIGNGAPDFGAGISTQYSRPMSILANQVPKSPPPAKTRPSGKKDPRIGYKPTYEPRKQADDRITKPHHAPQASPEPPMTWGNEESTRPGVQSLSDGWPAPAPSVVTVDLNAARGARKRHAHRSHEPATVIVSVDDPQLSPNPKPHKHDPDSTMADASGSYGFMQGKAPFVGRQREMEYLLGWERRVLSGMGGFVMLEGAAGMGKSRLVEEFRLAAEKQGRIRVVQGGYAEHGLGTNSGLRKAVSHLLKIDMLPETEAEAVIARRLGELDIGSTELVHMMMAVLRPRRSQQQAASTTTFGVATPAVYRVLERLLIRESMQHPVAMLIEDLQWADPFTIGFAEYLATVPDRRRPSSTSALTSGSHGTVKLPLLILCTLRRDKSLAKPELIQAFQHMGRHLGLGFGRLELGRLDEASAITLVKSMGKLEPDMQRDLVHRSAGSPMYILQALQCLKVAAALNLGQTPNTWSLPTDMFELIQRRTALIAARHPEGQRCQELARLIAVLGLCFSRTLVESYLVHLGRDDLVRRMKSLLATLQLEGILVPSEDRLSFEHILVQEALKQPLQADPNLSRYHEAAARAKEIAGFDNDGLMMGWLGGIAHHWAKAGDRERALEYSLREARAAEASWDLKSARELYRKVEEELRLEQASGVMRVDVQFALGRLHSRLGELGPAEDMLRSAITLASQSGDRRAEGKAQVVLGKVLTWQSRYRQALRCFRRAMACFSALAETTPIDLAGLADAQLGQGEVARVRGDLGTAETTLTQALHKARQSKAVDVEAHSLQRLGRISYLGGRLADAMHYFQGAVEQFEQAGLVVEGTSALSDLALVQLPVHGRHRALATVNQALKTLEVAGERLEAANAKLHQGIILRRGMDLDAPTECAKQSLQTFKELNHTYGIAKATLLTGELDLLRGDIDQAELAGQTSLRLHETISDAHGTALCLMFLGCCALEQGRVAEAHAQLTHGLDIVKKSGIMLYRARCHAHLGRIEEQNGDLTAAHQFYVESYNESLRDGNQESIAYGAILLGGLAFIQGQLNEARSFLESGLDIANEIDVAEHRAAALFGLAWLETLNGQFNARRPLLEQLTPMVKPLNTPDFYLRERVARVAKTVTVVHGASTAEQYRRAALDVIHNLR